VPARPSRSFEPATLRRPFLIACFVLSGAGSLVLETVWSRALELVFGSTTLAVTTVLVAYMLGLGLGGAIGGRFGRRLANPVRVYGVLELAIAACAVLVPEAIDAIRGLSVAVSADLGPAALTAFRFALSLAVLLVPTVMMGATFPIVVAAIARDDGRVGLDVGLVYGLNTIGAVAGVLGSVFLLLPWLGLRGTGVAGAAIDAAVGVIAVAGLLGSYAVVGGTALALEVCWTRALAMVFGASIYAFASILASFLLGIGLGSVVARGRVDRLRDPALHYALGIALLATLALATSFALPRLADVYVFAAEVLGRDVVGGGVLQVALATVAMLPVTFVLGALLPLVVRALAPHADQASRASGAAYLVNTLGSAAGAFGAGFVLVPLLGLAGTIALVVAGAWLTAAGLLALRGGAGLRGAAVALGAAALVLVIWRPSWDPEPLTRGVYYQPRAQNLERVPLLPLEGIERRELLLYRDGVSSTVSVHRDRGELFLRVNGKTDASSRSDMPTQVLLAQVPLLFGDPAKDVLVVGLASGVTVGSVALHPVERIDVVEIEPATAEAARFFDGVSGAPLDDPRVRVIFDDARSYLEGASGYDLVISQPSNPWMSGVSNLFTRESFAATRRALRPDGSLFQWVHVYGLEPASLRSIFAALRAEFPYLYVFSVAVGSGDWLVLARTTPLAARPLASWSALDPRVREDLRRIRIYSIEDLWSLVRLLPPEVDAWLGRAAVENTDDNLAVELAAPRALHADTIHANWAPLAHFGGGPAAAVLGAGGGVDDVAAVAVSYEFARGDREMAGRVLRSQPGAQNTAFGIVLEASRTGADVDAALDRAVSLRPDAPLLRLLRGERRLAAGSRESALVDIEHALEHLPGDPEAQLLRAQALVALGRVPDAAVAIDALLDRPLENLPTRAWRQAAVIYSASGQLDRAQELLEQVATTEPQSSEVWSALARIRLALGDPDGAARAERNAATAERNRARLLHREALAALETGERMQARALLERAIALDAQYAGAREELERLR